MAMAKVSILIPIFNVEKYLVECLDSVISQTLKDIEIICINDGSTDSSLSIIKKYAAKDPRIVVIDKKNSGYGDSMNQGLKKASGEYIGIVESDDWAEPDMFEKLYKLAKKHDVEVVKSNFFEYLSNANSNKKFNLFLPREVDKVLDPVSSNSDIFLQMPAIWSGIYRRDFLNKNDIKFLPTPGASFQDTGFNFKVWASAKKVYFTDQAYLHYRIDNESSSVKSLAKVYNVNQEYASIKDFLKKKKLLKKLGPVMEYAKFGACYWNLKRLPRKLAREYITTMSQEFRQARQDGLLDLSIFEPFKANILTIIMDKPKMYFVAKRGYGLIKVARKVKHMVRR
jgi:glycosyltransferase involved in cell wall biosynthesis